MHTIVGVSDPNRRCGQASVAPSAARSQICTRVDVHVTPSHTQHPEDARFEHGSDGMPWVMPLLTTNIENVYLML